MAKTLPKLMIVLFTIFISSSALVSTSQADESYYKTMSPSNLGLKREKFVNIHFYLHSIVGGPDQNQVIAAAPSTTNISLSSIPFGLVGVHDYSLTEKGELSSKQVGRAQGMFAISSQTDDTPLMVMTILFTQGKYNGSTLSVLGRNPYTTTSLRELPIVGGSGLFKLARGYILTSTYFSNATAVETIFEYNLYVLHY